MALKIRLARGGAKKRPFYRIVATDSRNPRDGRFIEKLGTYNPLLKKEGGNRVEMNNDRIEYWLGQGAIPSDRIVSFLNDAGIGKDNKFVRAANKRREQSIERNKEALELKRKEEEAAKKAAEEAAKKEAEEAAKAEAEAKAAEEAAAAESEEAPAEEAPAEEAKEAAAEEEEEKKAE